MSGYLKPPDKQFAREHAPALARSALIEMADVEGHGRVIGRRMFVTLVTAGRSSSLQSFWKPDARARPAGLSGASP